MRRSGLALALAGLLLGGCGNDPGTSSITAGVLGKIKAAAAGAAAPATAPAAASAAPAAKAPTPAEAAVMLRQSLGALGVPVLRVTIASIKADTFLTPRDTNSGTESWQTADATVFTFRDGVLISTRGAVADLMSSAAPSARQIASGTGTHQRSYYFLGDEDRTQRVDMTCRLAVVGAERVDFLGVAHDTRHVRESCDGAGRTVQNDYWIEAGGGFRKSRQWIGDRIGHAEFFRVID